MNPLASVRCVWLTTSVADAQINAIMRMIEVVGRLPTVDELRARGKEQLRRRVADLLVWEAAAGSILEFALGQRRLKMDSCGRWPTATTPPPPPPPRPTATASATTKK